MFEPIKTVQTRNYQLIIDQFRRLIEQGVLRIGDKLESERSLCQQLNVSRTSVREALIALELAGVIERRPEGKFIANTDRIFFEKTQEILLEEVSAYELLEARMAIEKEIAAIAAKNRTEEDLRNLEMVLLKLEQITDYRRHWIDKDLDYHMAIAKATNNRVLLQTMEVVVAPIKRKLWQSMNEEILETPTSVKKLTKEHWAIFEAIKNKDPQQAVKAVEAHLQTVSKNLLSPPTDKNGLAL